MMIRGLDWLFSAARLRASGFFPGLAEAIVAGAGLFGNWLSGRSRSKQHERQIASEERRHTESVEDRAAERRARREEYRWYLQQALEREKAFRARQAAALAAVAPGIHGAPAGLAALAPGGGASMPPPMSAEGVGALPIQTSGMPPQTAMFDWTQVLPFIRGGAPQQAQAAAPSGMAGTPFQAGMGAGRQGSLYNPPLQPRMSAAAGGMIPVR